MGTPSRLLVGTPFVARKPLPTIPQESIPTMFLARNPLPTMFLLHFLPINTCTLF